jgi:hypothetical protein
MQIPRGIVVEYWVASSHLFSPFDIACWLWRGTGIGGTEPPRVNFACLRELRPA